MEGKLHDRESSSIMPRVAKKKEEAVSLETVLWNYALPCVVLAVPIKKRDAVISLCFLILHTFISSRCISCVRIS